MPPKKKAISVATPVLQAQTKLYFSPAFLKLSSPLPQEISVMVDTEKNTISQAQVEIQYDPKAVTITSVRSGNFFSNTLPLVNKNDAGRGRIEFAIGFSERQRSVNGVGQLAIIQLAPGPEATLSARTQLSFLPKSSVRAQDQTASLLSATENLIIDFSALTPIIQPSL